MKAFLKRHAVVVCVLICLLIMAGAWLGIRLSADAGTYALKDMTGDASQLDDLEIQMTLSDGAHAQHLTLDRGELEHTFEYLPPFTRHDYESNSYFQNYVEHEDADVKRDMNTRLENEDEEYESWVTHMSREVDRVRLSAQIIRHSNGNGYDEHVQVLTDVTVYDESHPFVFNYESYKDVYKQDQSAQGEAYPIDTGVSPYEYMGMDSKNTEYAQEEYYDYTNLTAEDENGTFYFTPGLRPNHGGTSAIYRVDEWGSYYMIEPSLMDGQYEYYNDTEVPYGVVTPVVTFAVDGHEMRTLRLDVVDDKLCLLLVTDGMLTLRVYDKVGVLLSEVQIVKMSPQRELSGEIYINETANSKMLCYHLWDRAVYDETTGEWQTMKAAEDILFCVELGEQASLRSVITNHPALAGCAFVGSRWVLLEWGRNEDEIMTERSYYPNHDYLSIIDEKGTMLYQGEILTDAIEDTIALYQLTEFQLNDHYGDLPQRMLAAADVFAKEKQS